MLFANRKVYVVYAITGYLLNPNGFRSARVIDIALEYRLKFLIFFAHWTIEIGSVVLISRDVNFARL